jgi:3-oxoacyl-[acyl-carrier protein] reductase
MDLGLAGKVALVTASSGGMGRNIARTLAKEGANIVLFARSADKLQELAASIEDEFKVRALPVAGSMTNPQDVGRLIASIERGFSSLDIAVLNTGRPPSPLRATTDETDKSRWDQSYETLLSGVIEVTRCVHPLMERGGWGRIIAITSASVHQPMPHHALSTVFRAGVEAYMKHLSNEVGTSGITVNCVAPALIETPHRNQAEGYSPEQSEKRRNMNVLRRLGAQDELCAVVAFLASVQAGFITGESIRVDGGLVTSLYWK